MSLQAIQAAIAQLKSPAKAKQMMRFFKTNPGEYGEGDVFLGLTNPQCREIAASNKTLPNEQITALLSSKIHEQRFIALVVMDHKFKKAENQEEMYKLYLRSIAHVNNWDLVDLSAPNIIGRYLYSRCQSFQEIKAQDDPRTLLYRLVKSPIIWERRISIISTLTFIRKGQFYDTMQLSKLLLHDKQDLIHKAVGWMLRQVGKRDQPLLQQFLRANYNQIPRTCLRYSIQKFEEEKRLNFLKGDF